MLGQRSGRIILGNPEAGNVTVIRLLQQPKGGAGYCDSLDILLQWNSAPFTAGDAIPLSIQTKGAVLVIRAFISRFEIPRPRPSSSLRDRAISSIANSSSAGIVLRAVTHHRLSVLLLIPKWRATDSYDSPFWTRATATRLNSSEKLLCISDPLLFPILKVRIRIPLLQLGSQS